MSSWKKRAVGCGVLFWMLLLVLAAWPKIVRPAFLDVPRARAYYTLRAFGIAPGQPLFQTDISPWKQHGYCLFVREQGSAGRTLFPPDGECRIYGFHPRLPPVHRATHRMLSTAWKRRGIGGEPTDAEAYLVASIGRAFCRAAEPPVAAVEGIWIWYYRHYGNGSVNRRNGIYFDYACGSETLGELRWHPDDGEVLERWGSAPW